MLQLCERHLASNLIDPFVTPAKGWGRGWVSKEARHQSGLWRVLFTCNEPCGHMGQTQMDGWLCHVLSKTCWETHLSPQVVMHAPNKPSRSCATPASMTLLTACATLDRVTLLLLTVFPFHNYSQCYHRKMCT